jgi:hypothetical protein
VYLTRDLSEAEHVARQVAEADGVPDWLELEWPGGERGQSDFIEARVVEFQAGRPVSTVASYSGDI